MTEQTGDGGHATYGALGTPSIAMRIVDGRRLEKKFRDVLKPGGVLADSKGQAHGLPRYFYEIPSWDVALSLQLSEHFALWEFIHTDIHEAEPLRTFPRYVPCAITLLALGLEQFRYAVGSFVHIAVAPQKGRITHKFGAHCYLCGLAFYCEWPTAEN